MNSNNGTNQFDFKIRTPLKVYFKFIGLEKPEIEIKIKEQEYLKIDDLVFQYIKFESAYLCRDIEEFLSNIEIIFEQINEHGNDDKFKLMDSLIYLSEESGVHYYQKKYLKQTLVKKLYDYSGGKEYERYLNLCLDNKNEEWFKFKDETAGKSPLDREEEVYKIVFENYKKGVIRKELFCDKKDILQEKIKSWFLANYDLYNLKRFEKGLKLHKKPCCAEKKEKIEFKAFEYNDIIKNDNRFQLRNLLFVVLPLAAILVLFFQLPPLNYINPHYSNVFRIFVGTAMIFIIFFMCCINKFDNYSSLLRLAGCILAEYFAINSDESWSGILLFENDWLKIIYRWIILGLFTFLYLNREISNKIKKNKISEKLKKSVSQKTRAFFIRTAGYSLIIGIFFSDFFGKVLILRNTDELEKLLDIPAIESIAHFPFIAGNIYP